MGKKVSRVELHDGFFVPGLLQDQGGGQFGKSIPPANKTLENLDMTLLENGSVEIEWGKDNAKNAITIGAANIKYAMHAARPKETTRAK